MPRKNCSVTENWLIIYEMTRGRENLISKGYLLIKFPKQKTYINNYAQPLYSRSLSALKNGSVYLCEGTKFGIKYWVTPLQGLRQRGINVKYLIYDFTEFRRKKVDTNYSIA